MNLLVMDIDELFKVNNNFDGGCNFCKAEYLGHPHSPDCLWKRRYDELSEKKGEHHDNR